MFCFVEPSLCSDDFELRKELISRFASLRYAIQFGDGFLFLVRIVKGRVLQRTISFISFFPFSSLLLNHPLIT